VTGGAAGGRRWRRRRSCAIKFRSKLIEPLRLSFFLSFYDAVAVVVAVVAVVAAVVAPAAELLSFSFILSPFRLSFFNCFSNNEPLVSWWLAFLSFLAPLLLLLFLLLPFSLISPIDWL